MYFVFSSILFYSILFFEFYFNHFGLIETKIVPVSIAFLNGIEIIILKVNQAF